MYMGVIAGWAGGGAGFVMNASWQSALGPGADQPLVTDEPLGGVDTTIDQE